MRKNRLVTLMLGALLASSVASAAGYNCDLMYGYAGLGSSGKARTREVVQVDGASVVVGSPMANGETHSISMRTNSVTKDTHIELSIPGVGHVGSSYPAGSNSISVGFNLYEGTEKATLVNLYCYKVSK